MWFSLEGKFCPVLFWISKTSSVHFSFFCEEEGSIKIPELDQVSLFHRISTVECSLFKKSTTLVCDSVKSFII